MSTSMKLWPMAWKEQYNKEVRRRTEAMLRAERFDSITNDRLSSLPVDESNLLSSLVYVLPKNHLIFRILRDGLGSIESRTLLLSWHQLRSAEKTPTCYLSERDRLVVLLNKYFFQRSLDRTRDLALKLPVETTHSFEGLLKGIIFLDVYLMDVQQKVILLKAIDQLLYAEDLSQTELGGRAIKAILCFSFYMNGEHDRCRAYLRNFQRQEYQQKFAKLLWSLTQGSAYDVQRTQISSSDRPSAHAIGVGALRRDR